MSLKIPNVYENQNDGTTIIKITRQSGEVRLAIVDTEDVELLEKYQWFLRNYGNGCDRFYALTNVYPYTRGGVPQLRMHRLILKAEDGYDVDHINGNLLDNRKSNLRVLLHAHNMQNYTRLNSNNTTGYRGVYYFKREGTYHAKASRTYLGTYSTPEKAAEAVIKWRRENMPFSEMDKEAA